MGPPRRRGLLLACGRFPLLGVGRASAETGEPIDGSQRLPDDALTHKPLAAEGQNRGPTSTAQMDETKTAADSFYF
jgi:hypothetical protein